MCSSVSGFLQIEKWDEDRTNQTTPRVTPAHIAYKIPELKGSIQSEYLMTYTDGGNASFVFTDIVKADDFAGRKGSFVAQGKGTFDAKSFTVKGDFNIVEGTGTKGMEGAKGPAGRSSRRHIVTLPATVAPRHSQTLVLPDGRSLGYGEYGHHNGPAIFYFHGWPSSRLEGAGWDSWGKRRGVRFITADRPGMGISSFQPNRKIMDWPADVSQLARHLKLRRYRVIGVSGGGPYALACANALPREKLLAVGVWAGIGPSYVGTSGMSIEGRIHTKLMVWLPSLMRWLHNHMTQDVRNLDRELFDEITLRSFHHRDGQDGVVSNSLRRAKMFSKPERESWRQGSRGNVDDFRLSALPWGFELEDIKFDKVKLWYGTEDTNVPIKMGREIAKRLRYADLKEYPGRTHEGLGHYHADEIMDDLMKHE